MSGGDAALSVDSRENRSRARARSNPDHPGGRARIPECVNRSTRDVDKTTGRELFGGAESAYQRPQVVRALYEAATALERFERRKSQLPQKTGEP
jgi:hypothetical protein